MKAFIPLDGGMDLNRDGRVTIDELARSTLLIAVWLFAGLGALSVLVILIFKIVLTPYDLLVLALVLGAASMAISFALGVYRMLYPERSVRRELLEMKRRHKREDYEFDQLRGVSEDARSTSLAQADIDAAAFTIITRHYAGKPFTRDACVDAGLMTAAAWNDANALLKKRGIRHGRKSEFRPDTFAEAWGIYCEHKLKANQHRISNGDWTEKR